MQHGTQLMMGGRLQIRSSLFNLLQPVKVDGHILQQAGLLDKLQHRFLSAQPLLFSVHLWGVFQDVVAPPLCNYLNHKENKQVSNSPAIPTGGSCDQQQRRKVEEVPTVPPDVGPRSPLPPWSITI